MTPTSALALTIPAALLATLLPLGGGALVAGEPSMALRDTWAPATPRRGVQLLNAPSRVVVDLSSYFAGHDGCFCLLDLSDGSAVVFNDGRAGRRLPPQSTFKVANALFALETGAAQDENSLRRWDGTDHGMEEWNRDHTLRSAIRYSVVWYFKEVAREVGPERMSGYLRRIGYGNGDISGGIDGFWLQSSLRISAWEQVAFVAKLYRGQLPFGGRSQHLVRKMLVLQRGPGFTFSGKTGSSADGTLGWFIGSLRCRGKRCVFAANLAGSGDAGGAVAQQIVRRILADRLGVAELLEPLR